MNKIQQIKLLVLDMDGVMTDGSIHLSADGTQSRIFNAKDGEGIKRVQKKGVIVAIITGSKEKEIVYTRAGMLNIANEYVTIDTRDKLPVLESLRQNLLLSYDQIAYIGDDLPDIPVLEKVGVSACPADAVNQVKAVVDICLSKNGGEGCVREFIDYILFP